MPKKKKTTSYFLKGFAGTWYRKWKIHDEINFKTHNPIKSSNHRHFTTYNPNFKPSNYI